MNYFDRKYKRTLVNQRVDSSFFIASEISSYIPISPCRNQCKNSTRVRTFTGINEETSNLRLCKASSGTGGSADRGGFVHGGPRLPDVDDRIKIRSRKNSHILRTYKRAINCIDSP